MKSLSHTLRIINGINYICNTYVSIRDICGRGTMFSLWNRVRTGYKHKVPCLYCDKYYTYNLSTNKCIYIVQSIHSVLIKVDNIHDREAHIIYINGGKCDWIEKYRYLSVQYNISNRDAEYTFYV
jgi:hypothetical protein